MLYVFELVRDYDDSHVRQSDAVRSVTAEVFADETARLEALESRSPQHAATARELLGLIELATATDVDLPARLAALTDFDDRAPTLVTPAGRASLQLATGVYVPPASLALERAVADALINDRIDDFSLPQDEVVLALTDGSGGSLPLNPSATFAGPDQDVESLLPAAFSAIERELERSGDLRRSADWLAQFSPFFEGGAQAIDIPPATVDDDLDASVSLFIRIDRILASELQRVINTDRVDAGQRSNRGWAIGIFGAIFATAMFTLATAAVIRRRRENTLSVPAHSLDPVTGLATRRDFNARADRHLANGNGGHVLFHVDVDELRKVNDELGHTAGDNVLFELSRRLESITERWRESLSVDDAHIARLGGDDFIVALHGVDLTIVDLGQLAGDLGAHTNGPVDTMDGPADLTVSIGCSSAHAGTSLDELARRSELALFDAKHTGRSRSSVVVDADAVDWDSPSIAQRLLADHEPTTSDSAAFVRELVDLTQRFGVELTTSTQPAAHTARGTDGLHVNLILVQPRDATQPNRRFTDFPASADGASATAQPTPGEQH